MPNIYYMVIQSIHLMALAIWVGGSAMVGMIAAPVIFKRLESRTQAGEVVGDILARFDRVIFFCIVALAMTSVVKFTTWENPNYIIATRYLALFLMSVSALYSAKVISPKMRSLKLKIKAFEDLPPDNYNRMEFNRLHKTSFNCFVLNMICGTICIFLA